MILNHCHWPLVYQKICAHIMYMYKTEQQQKGGPGTPVIFPKTLGLSGNTFVLPLNLHFQKKIPRACSRKSFCLQYFPKDKGDLLLVKRNSQVLQRGLLSLFKGLFYNHPKKVKELPGAYWRLAKKHPNGWESSLNFGKRISTSLTTWHPSFDLLGLPYSAETGHDPG